MLDQAVGTICCVRQHFANISPTSRQLFHRIFPRCQILGKCWANVGQHLPNIFDVGDTKNLAQINQHLRPNILPNKCWRYVGQMLVECCLICACLKAGAWSEKVDNKWSKPGAPKGKWLKCWEPMMVWALSDFQKCTEAWGADLKKGRFLEQFIPLPLSSKRTSLYRMCWEGQG